MSGLLWGENKGDRKGKQQREAIIVMPELRTKRSPTTDLTMKIRLHTLAVSSSLEKVEESWPGCGNQTFHMLKNLPSTQRIGVSNKELLSQTIYSIIPFSMSRFHAFISLNSSWPLPWSHSACESFESDARITDSKARASSLPSLPLLSGAPGSGAASGDTERRRCSPTLDQVGRGRGGRAQLGVWGRFRFGQSTEDASQNEIIATRHFKTPGCCPESLESSLASREVWFTFPRATRDFKLRDDTGTPKCEISILRKRLPWGCEPHPARRSARWARRSTASRLEPGFGLGFRCGKSKTSCSKRPAFQTILHYSL